jgi:ABC-2 type transport system permease protein
VANFRELLSELAIAGRIARSRLQGQMQYRASFVFQIAGNFIINFAELLALIIMFQHFHHLGGWDIREVIFLYGLSATMFGLAQMIGSGLDQFPAQMRLGEFDRVLTRPLSTFIQASVTDISLRYFGQMLQGLVILGYAVFALDVHWTAAKLLLLFLSIFSGVVLFLSLFAIEAVLCFWTVESTEAINAFTYGGSDLAQYPLSIFDRWLRRLFLWLIPIGFVSYFPAVTILDKHDPLGFPAWTGFAAPLAAGLFALATGWLWGFGVRHYRSTGS